VKRYATPEAVEAAGEKSDDEDELSPLEDYSEDEAPGMEL